MKVVILSHADVGNRIAATLISRGHEVAFVGGAVHDALLAWLEGFDGCVLLSDEPEFAAIAAAFRTRGKAIWTEWPDIPPAAAASC